MSKDFFYDFQLYVIWNWLYNGENLLEMMGDEWSVSFPSMIPVLGIGLARVIILTCHVFEPAWFLHKFNEFGCKKKIIG